MLPISGVEPAQSIKARAEIRAKGGQRMWFRHHFGTDPKYATLPLPPAVEVAPAGAVSTVAALVDTAGSELEVEEVRVWWSNDDSFLYAGYELDGSGNLYVGVVPFALQPNSVWFVDVQYETNALLFPERFSVSSPPSIPAGLVPHIRDMESCL